MRSKLDEINKKIDDYNSSGFKYLKEVESNMKE